MALIRCSRCGNLVSDRAAACPKCGNPVGSEVTVQQVSKPAPKPALEEISRDVPSSNNGKGGLYAVIGILAAAVLGLGIYALSGRDAGYSNEAMEAVDSTAVEAIEPIDSAAMAAAMTVEVEDNTTENNSSSFDCHSEDLDAGGDYGVSQSYFYEGKSARINNSWLEHDVNEGIRIHVGMNTSNLLNRQVEVVCFFWFNDGRQVKSTDGQYESRERQVCTQTVVTPAYQECNWSDLQLFIPYRQIKSQHDWKHLKCRVEVFYNGRCLATGNYMHFGCWLN